MAGEASSFSGQYFYNNPYHAVSSSRLAADGNEHEICVQTGEEFSTEFLRDRVVPRGVPVLIDTDQRQPKEGVKGSNENPQMVYETLNSILGLRNSECSSDILDFVAGKGHAAELQNRVHPDKAIRIHREYSAPRLGSGQLFEDFNCDQGVPGHATPSHYILESPQQHHCHGSEASDASFYDKMKFLCSFGGRVLPRPNDGKLRYVGGETKIISIRKNLAWVELVKKTFAICNQPHIIKYQLPGEDLDALISVSSDEDLHHMMEEYLELERIEGSQRLRIFLVPVSESESPCSFERRATQQNEADYQYVVAVNGMLDPSLQNNSSGQSVSSQAGNTCDHRDPPFVHSTEMKDGGSSSNLVGMFTNHTAQFLTTLQTPTKSFQQSPPLSPLPVQNKDPQSSAMHFFEDHACHDGHESINQPVTDQWPCDNACCVDSPSYYHNNPYGPVPLMNYYHRNKHFLETDHINKLPSLRVPNYHRRDVFSPVSGQRELDLERPVLKERAFHSHPKDPMGLLSGSTNDLVGSYHRMLHVLSDSKLRKHEGMPDYHLEKGITPLSPMTFKVQKSPSFRLSNSPLEERSFQPQESGNEKYQESYQNQPTFTAHDCKGKNGVGQHIGNWVDEKDTQVGQERKHNEVVSNHTSQDKSTLSNTDLQNVHYNPNSVSRVHISPLEFQGHGDKATDSSSMLMIPGNSADTVKEQPQDCSLGESTPNLIIKSQNATKDLLHSMTEVIGSESVPYESTQLLFVASQRTGDQEAAVPSSASLTPLARNKSNLNINLQNNHPLSAEPSSENPGKNVVIGGVSSLRDEDPVDFLHNKVEVREGCSYKKLNPEDAILIHSESSCNHHNVHAPGAAVIVEDVTDILSPGILLSSPLITHVEDEASDEITSSEKTEAESDIQESEGEVIISLFDLKFDIVVFLFGI